MLIFPWITLLVRRKRVSDVSETRRRDEGLLFNSNDIKLGHYRRYTTADLVSKLEKAGFKIIEQSHFAFLGVPYIFYRNLKERFSKAEYEVDFSPTLDAILLFILRIEKYIIRFIPLPLGTSLYVLARK